MPLDDFIDKSMQRYDPQPLTIWQKLFGVSDPQQDEMARAQWEKWKRELHSHENQHKRDMEQREHAGKKKLEANNTICDHQTQIYVENQKTYASASESSMKK